jgi:integrase
MKATLRKRKLKGNRLRLYLDIYPPVPHPDTGKPTRREFLKLFLYQRPRNEEEREHNRETKQLAKTICAERQLQLQRGNYDFLAKYSGNENFLNFFKEQVEYRAKIKRNYQSWRSTYLYLYRFTEGYLPLKKIRVNFCKSFREYLQNTHCLNSTRPLKQNSAAGYFDVFKEAVAKANEEQLLKENFARKVKSIPYKQTEREFLTFEEVKAVAKATCSDETLKRAALFSIFTGLRFGDIRDLKWKEVRHSEVNGHFLRFKVNKPNRPETLFISEQARKIIGENGDPEEQVFKGLKYGNHITPTLNKWMQKAGIDRHITFHAFRHTFATLQISFGTDIYVLKDLLAQKNVQTTQIYARVLDEKKKEATSRIPEIDLGEE